MGATLSRSATYLWQAGWWVGRYVLIYTSITPTKALVTSTIVRYRIQHLIDSLKTIPEFLTNIEDTIRMYICHLYFFFRKIMFCKWSWETQKKKLSGNWSLCCIKCPQLNWVNHLHKLGRGGEAWRAESGQEGRGGHVYLTRDAKQEHGPINHFKMQQASLW